MSRQGPLNPRKGWIEGGVGYVPLSQNKISKVDPSDVKWLENWNWCAHWEKNTNSFVAQKGTEIGGVSKKFKMHRFILGIIDPDIKVDHENHDTLDNRRFNLRACSNPQNLWNSRTPSNNTSGCKGVSYVSRVNKFRAYYTIGGKQIHLGYFDTLLEAKLRRQEEAKKVYGEFAFEDEKYEII